MIQLKDVAVEEVLRLSRDRDFYDFAIKNSIKTVEELEDYIKNHPHINWEPLYESIEEIERTLFLRNRVEREPIKFFPREYEDYSLFHTDEFNNGKILLLNNPTREHPLKYRELDNLTMEEIKRLLTLTTAKGDNYLLSLLKNVGSQSASKLLEAVNMYSDQVERQAELAKNRRNYFVFQQGKKRLIVEDQYRYIIEYLMANTNEFVWGDLSDNQRAKFEASIKDKNPIDSKIRSSMIDIVANYTTVPELEGVCKGDYKPLHRLIKTPNKNNNKV